MHALRRMRLLKQFNLGLTQLCMDTLATVPEEEKKLSGAVRKNHSQAVGSGFLILRSVSDAGNGEFLVLVSCGHLDFNLMDRGCLVGKDDVLHGLSPASGVALKRLGELSVHIDICVAEIRVAGSAVGYQQVFAARLEGERVVAAVRGVVEVFAAHSSDGPVAVGLLIVL